MPSNRLSASTILLDSHSTDLGDEEIDAAERQFFNQLVLPNGTLKTTSAGRLPDVDKLSAKYLAEFEGRVRLLDVAVSSGVTTVEWASALEKSGIDYSLDAFDICVDGHIVNLLPALDVLVDSSGRPIQFEPGPFIVGNHLGEECGRKLRRLVPVSLLRVVYGLLSPLRNGESARIPIKLVSRRVRQNPAIDVFELDLHDVDKLSGSYDMIRAANILNNAYFPKDVLELFVRKILRRLLPNGYLVVVRTHDNGENHGSIYQFSEGKLRVCERVGEGSEIDGICTSIEA